MERVIPTDTDWGDGALVMEALRAATGRTVHFHDEGMVDTLELLTVDPLSYRQVAWSADIRGEVIGCNFSLWGQGPRCLLRLAGYGWVDGEKCVLDE